jgi:hypothetical protein
LADPLVKTRNLTQLPIHRILFGAALVIYNA